MHPLLAFALLAQQLVPAQLPPAQPDPYGGEPVSVPIELSDDVPLPVPAVIEPGPDGDRVVEPASGDPYFLAFTAGRHYPPADERIDPALIASLRTDYGDGRPTHETYAFVMFSRRITEARIDALRALGVRVLEFHPHYSLKVALAPEALDALATLDFVRWVGVPRPWQKVHRAMGAALGELRSGELQEAYVSVFDSDLNALSTSRAVGTLEVGGPDGIVRIDDPALVPAAWMSNGWQQRVLESLGLEILEYVESIRAFRVRLAPTQVEPLVALDFVQFVEPQGVPELAHDESMPMVNADYTRQFFNGGSPAIVGEGDSGIEYSHADLTGFYWVGANLSSSPEPTTDDPCGHGTHVAGTIMGRGVVDASHTGAAPAVAGTMTTRFFNTKMFHGVGCAYGGASMATVFGTFDSDYTDGFGNVTPRPHVINQSWGTTAPSGGAFGTEADCRTIDASVFSFPQLHVFSAGNDGPAASTLKIEASAKNVFTIGGVRDYALGAEDPGVMYSGSSRGPLADGRWKPNLSAPASSILSCDSGNLTGYVAKTGTSMASPHVTGVAAQLMERHPFLRHNPTATGALLMSSAMTKDNILLSTPTATHLDSYGTGRLEAYKAHYGAGSVFFWGWAQGTVNGTYVDVAVPAGATRIAVCLYYHEAAASAGAATALVNDLDLWIDSPIGGISATTNTGEYSAQQSTLDNTEIRLIDSPPAGTWRIKVHPQSATSNSRVGLAMLVHSDDTTPDGTLTATASRTAIQPNEAVNITATAYNPEYVASAVFLDITSAGDTLVSATGTLEGGASVNYLDNGQDGRNILLGNIRPTGSRAATWSTSWATEGFKNFTVDARSDNWVDKTEVVALVVDGTPPPLPTNFVSSTHPLGTWVNSNAFTVSWTQMQDPLSGINGYSVVLGPSALLPDTTIDSTALPTFSGTLPGSWGQFYLSVRPTDRSRNWPATFASYGPILYDALKPSFLTGVLSPTHPLGSYRCNGIVTMTWNPMTDVGGSGIAGASWLWNQSSSTVPDATLEGNASATSFTTLLGPSTLPWYFHIRPYDNAGNGGNVYNFGPIYITSATPVTYCTGKTNSLGCVPSISSTGTPSISFGNLQVQCSNALNQKSGLLFFGSATNAAPFQGGTLCISAPFVRTPTQLSNGAATGNSCTGSYSFTFTPQVYASAGIVPGDTVCAQWWMRDPASPSTTGLSNALRFTACQ